MKKNCNKKPNIAKKKSEKGQMLFAVLLFLCHIATSKLQNFHSKFYSKFG